MIKSAYQDRIDSQVMRIMQIVAFLRNKLFYIFGSFVLWGAFDSINLIVIHNPVLDVVSTIIDLTFLATIVFLVVKVSYHFFKAIQISYEYGKESIREIKSVTQYLETNYDVTVTEAEAIDLIEGNIVHTYRGELALLGNANVGYIISIGDSIL